MKLGHYKNRSISYSIFIAAKECSSSLSIAICFLIYCCWIHLMDVTDDRNELPEELLELVFMHLQYVQDILRFGVVCRSWSFVASEVTQLFKPSSPILLLPPNNNNKSCRLFSLSMNKGVEIQLEGTYGAWCCNSWNGWLLTIDYTPPYAINFLDIMSGYKFSCPQRWPLSILRPKFIKHPLKPS